MRRTKTFLSLLFITLFCLFHSGSAKADWRAAAVQCDGDHNRILIRFGMNGGHYSEIPESLSAQWTDVPTEEDDYFSGSVCLFNDGKKIFISESADQETRGEAGGDVDAFFKMTIDGNIVYDDKQVYRGHGKSIWDISAVEYDGRTLLECNPHEVIDDSNYKWRRTANPTCYDVSVRLSRDGGFLSDQEKLTSKDERENPGWYYLPMPAPVLNSMIYARFRAEQARIRVEQIEHRYADADRDETELFRLRAKYTPNQPPGPTEYNMRCWARAHIPNLKGALDDCRTAIFLLNSHRSDPIMNKHVTKTEIDYELKSVADIYDSTGYVYLKMNLPANAIYYYSTAFNKYPKLASSLYGRALAERALGQTNAAAKDFASAKTIDPKITSDFGT